MMGRDLADFEREIQAEFEALPQHVQADLSEYWRWCRKRRLTWPKLIQLGSAFAVVYRGRAIDLTGAEADLLIHVVQELEGRGRVRKKDLGIVKPSTEENVWQDLYKKLPFLFHSRPGRKGGVRQMLPLFFGGVYDALDRGA